MFYGSAWEDDMEGGQFALLFMSLYCEGFARPKDGIRPILDLLVERFKNSGGEMRLRSSVRRIEVSEGRVAGLVLENNERIVCDAVLSSAGLMETINLCPEASPQDCTPVPGMMSFVESINIIDRPAVELGLDASITFFSANRKFRYRRSDLPVDVQSGVICVPGNFCYDTKPDTHMVRITNIADPAYWEGAENREYEKGKIEWREKSLEVVEKIVPKFADNVTYSDMFTPRTIKKFTGHINGAVYGSPVKLVDGVTPVKNLFICGTDQGYLGVVGSMISGVEIANQRLL
jgi:phytoene dehydrogenase-like protein